LSTNQLSRTIPSSLGALTELTRLYLSLNQLSGTIPSSLGALTALIGLDLNVNQLNRTILLSLGALTALTRFFLHRNQLVGTMPFCNSVQSFEYLVAKCAEVNCTCCNECCPVAFGIILKSQWCEQGCKAHSTLHVESFLWCWFALA
jgi:hypothetical protein